jgi:hypothetical protein
VLNVVLDHLIVNNVKTLQELFIINLIIHVIKFAQVECMEILTIMFVNNVFKVVNYALQQAIYLAYLAKQVFILISHIICNMVQLFVLNFVQMDNFKILPLIHVENVIQTAIHVLILLLLVLPVS